MAKAQKEPIMAEIIHNFTDVEIEMLMTAIDVYSPNSPKDWITREQLLFCKIDTLAVAVIIMDDSNPTVLNEIAPNLKYKILEYLSERLKVK